MTTMVTSSARQRVAKSLESESASIVVILGGFAVVAATILGAGLSRQSPAETTLAVAAVQAVDVEHGDGTTSGSATTRPIAATTEFDHGAEVGYRGGVLFSSRDTGAMAMQQAIAVGMPSSTEIRLTGGGPAAPAPPRHSQWWWMPVGLVTAGAAVTALRAGLRRRQTESGLTPRDVASEFAAN